MTQQPQMETTVKTYKNPQDYAKDAPKMAQDGWTVQQTSNYQPERSLAGKLFVPGGALTNPSSQIVVTYQRPAGSGTPLPHKETMPPGLSFKQQVEWHKRQRAIKAGMPTNATPEEEAVWKKKHPWIV